MVTKLTEETFGDFISEGRVLVKFGADWCGPCKMLDKILEKVGTDHPGVSIGIVNVDDCPGISTALKITKVPTMVTYVDGEVVGSVDGIRTESFIKSELGI